MAGHKVQLSDDSNPSDFYVKFHGPHDSLYTGGIYKIHVTLPAQYPYKSPSIGFSTRIYHPNIDEHSGSVCLDVINQSWSPMFDLLHIITIFLPQLLLYPNPSDPLNPQAAALLHTNKSAYEQKVKQHVVMYANKNIIFNSDDDSNSSDHDTTTNYTHSSGKHDTSAAVNINTNKPQANTTVCNSSDNDACALSDCDDDMDEPLSDMDDEIAGSLEL